MEYKINIIDNFEKKSYKWMYTIIDLVIFFILLFLVGWIGAFIVSAAIGYILNAADPLSKEDIKTSNYSLLFEKDQILFKSEEKDKSDIFVPYASINAVEDVKVLPETYNLQIVITRKNESGIIFTLSNHSQETFKEIFEKIKNAIKTHSNDEKIAKQNNQLETNEPNSYKEFSDKIKENLPNYDKLYLSDTYPKVLISNDSVREGTFVIYITYVPEITKDVVKSFRKAATKFGGSGGIIILASENIDDESKSYINGFSRRSVYAFYDLSTNAPISHKKFIRTNLFDFEN